MNEIERALRGIVYVTARTTRAGHPVRLTEDDWQTPVASATEYCRWRGSWIEGPVEGTLLDLAMGLVEGGPGDDGLGEPMIEGMLVDGRIFRIDVGERADEHLGTLSRRLRRRGLRGARRPPA